MNSNKIILAGDIGGTKTLLALYEFSGKHLIELKLKKYSSKEYQNLESIVKDFLDSQQINPSSAAFGIPGPVENGIAKSTNLPWVVDENIISNNLNIPKVKIINDLAATAYEIPFLNDGEKILIKEGDVEKRSEKFVVVAPGTGLGQAFLVCDGNKKIFLASEGGHTDFAPTNELETELYIYLSKKYNRVSYERVISAMGLINVFDFLVDSNFAKPEAETLKRMITEDKAAVITYQALNNGDKVCEKVLDIFVEVLGAHCGNLVITLLVTAGVYLAGGIPHKILPRLQTKIFAESFNNKGRLSEIVKATPVFVLNHNNAVLSGASKIALELLNEN